jgi:hypothetical protein
MRSLAAIFIALLIALPAAALPLDSAQAEVSVTFINSFFYSDLADKAPDKREATLSEIRNTLVDLGVRYLKPGQLLKIEVLNMDRITLPPATPSARPSHPKTDTQPLRMELQYALQQNGKTLLRSRDSVSDINYLANPVPPEAKKDALVHVKEMLSDWFTSTFPAD